MTTEKQMSLKFATATHRYQMLLSQRFVMTCVNQQGSGQYKRVLISFAKKKANSFALSFCSG